MYPMAQRGSAIWWAALAALAAPEASAASSIVTVPASLQAGDQYQLIFVTEEGFDASSPDISTYNLDVTTAAGLNPDLAAFDALNGVTWTAIVSAGPSIDDKSPDVAAQDNAPSLAPVYNLTGAEVSNSLYIGALLAPVNIDQFGGGSGARVWTGSDGEGQVKFPLGTGGEVEVGISNDSSGRDWLDGNFSEAPNPGKTEYQLYALSSVITVQTDSPEPAPGPIMLFVLMVAASAKVFRNVTGARSGR
jgi:hypothetical protein